MRKTGLCSLSQGDYPISYSRKKPGILDFFFTLGNSTKNKASPLETKLCYTPDPSEIFRHIKTRPLEIPHDFNSPQEIHLIISSISLDILNQTTHLPVCSFFWKSPIHTKMGYSRKNSKRWQGGGLKTWKFQGSIKNEMEHPGVSTKNCCGIG